MGYEIYMLSHVALYNTHCMMAFSHSLVDFYIVIRAGNILYGYKLAQSRHPAVTDLSLPICRRGVNNES